MESVSMLREPLLVETSTSEDDVPSVISEVVV